MILHEYSAIVACMVFTHRKDERLKTRRAFKDESIIEELRLNNFDSSLHDVLDDWISFIQILS